MRVVDCLVFVVCCLSVVDRCVFFVECCFLLSKCLRLVAWRVLFVVCGCSLFLLADCCLLWVDVGGVFGACRCSMICVVCCLLCVVR